MKWPNRRGRLWTAKEIYMLRKMSNEQVAEITGRTVKSVELKRYSFFLTPEKRTQIKERVRKWRAQYGRSDRNREGDLSVFISDPPSPRAIEEWRRRQELSPVSLTAAICGDPLPGYSALDHHLGTSG